MTREEAIEILWQYDVNFEPHPAEKVMHAIDMAIEALSADVVSREEYNKLLNDSIWESEHIGKLMEYQTEVAEPSEQYKKGFEDAKRSFLVELARERLSAEQKWVTDSKPTEDGEYMVTLDAFGQHRYIDLMHYGKPLMPNRKVKGMCWYHSDSEWGDIVYDDEDILAWLPLPTPYGESEVEQCD